MKNRFHVVTPFSRSENFEPLANMLYREGAASWTLLLTAGETVGVKELPPSAAMDWLHVCEVKAVRNPGIHIAISLVFEYIRTGDVVGSDRYVFLPDDDWLEPGFFEKIDSYTEPLIMVGMLRGQHTPTNPGHPTWPLIPARSSLSYGFTAFEQGIFSGQLLRDLRGSAEWMLQTNQPNEALLFHAARNNDTAYVPDVNIWFNYLEPGRWDK